MTKFVSQLDYPNIDAVKSEYSAADKIIQVEGGWMVFDTVDDYNTWISQI